MSHYEVYAWRDDNGPKDHVVVMIPVVDAFESRLWGNFKPFMIADCSKSDAPEENAMMIVRALNFMESNK